MNDGPISAEAVASIYPAPNTKGQTRFVGAEIAFHSDPGNVEDANVGDKSLGPISANDKVVVFGTHVYDGFHEGWHEFHPLMKVLKLPPDTEASAYMEWDPDFNDASKLPVDLPGMPANITGLTIPDMQQGLASQKFRDRAMWLRDKWCGLLNESVSQTTQGLQATEVNRWTIHPDVDGCQPQRDVPR